MSVYTPKKLYRGQPGTTDTLLYTVPGSTKALVKEITVANTTGSAATITLGLDSGGALAAANHYLSAKSVPANDSIVVACNQVLDAAATIRALQGTSSALTVHISGIEVA